jgi:hypothetical protein
MRHICRNLFVAVAAVKGANDMLMRGFTGAHDVGGPARTRTGWEPRKS